MWRASRRVIVECINFVMRCVRNNRVIHDFDDIPDYDIQDVPVYFQPQSFDVPVPIRQTEDLQHRPDAPCMRRRSPPELVSKMLQAIDELNETKFTSNVNTNDDEPTDDDGLTTKVS
ncbi:uncharacterized protein [Venturia canescens]|uniref:uncharacterized protein n=1 Tax=Venturia canescens TaxID=32260 RepID=UPI001C9CB94A|nr:uncharacterized protein LOC122409787 [Venturia canescens]